MSMSKAACAVCMFWTITAAVAQVPKVEPQIVTKSELASRVTIVEVRAHFVTAIRMPETVNSVVVGDPALFQAEHSEHEPDLVFVKALSTKAAETNLLISTTRGHEASLLLVSRGESSQAANVDFVVRYKPAGGFLIEPTGYPSPLVGETISTTQAPSAPVVPPPASPTPVSLVETAFSSAPTDRPPTSAVRHGGLDELLQRQERAPLPALYGEHVQVESASGDHLRAGVSEVIDGGQQVIVLFSAVNPTGHNILLMPPQVQLGGKVKSGKIIRHSHWASAEQLPAEDFRLSRRRLGPGERADGVVLFERPPYKQSNETLFLQLAEAGAVDRPALAPIGFGISISREESGDGRRRRATAK